MCAADPCNAHTNIRIKSNTSQIIRIVWACLICSDFNIKQELFTILQFKQAQPNMNSLVCHTLFRPYCAVWRYLRYTKTAHQTQQPYSIAPIFAPCCQGETSQQKPNQPDLEQLPMIGSDTKQGEYIHDGDMINSVILP